MLHVAPALYGADGRIGGGAERFAYELARRMAHVVPTRLVSFGPSDERLRDGELSVRIIGAPTYVSGHPYNPFSRKVLRELARADVVHCHQQHIFVSKAAAVMRRVAHKPVFVTDHGGGAWDFTGRLPFAAPFDAYLHVSDFSRRIAGQLDDPRARVIYAGVDLGRFSPPKVEGLRERVLFVGRLLPHKGVDTLIEALPKGAGLDIAGAVHDERFRADLAALARGRDVRFHHDWTDEEVREAYRSAACVVLPSVYRDRYGGESRVPELLGQTLLEGMACGAPGICTRVGGMPEVVRDDVTGFVVEPGHVDQLHDRLAQLLQDPSSARRMGQAAHRHVVDEFSWDRVVERCLDAYRRPGISLPDGGATTP